jgi:hypothetical protein
MGMRTDWFGVPIERMLCVEDRLGRVEADAETKALGAGGAQVSGTASGGQRICTPGSQAIPSGIVATYS